MSNTQVIQEVKLNLGGCLPIGSEITDVQVDCNPVDDQGNPIVDSDGRPVPQISIVQIDERGNQTTFITDLCPDKFMTVVDNEDGTITATNVDGVEVTWCKEPNITDGEGISLSGSVCDPENPLVITLSLCELDLATQEDIDSANTILIAGCFDGEQKLFPRLTLCQQLGNLEDGDGVDYDGSTTVTLDVVDPETCEKRKVTLSEIPSTCEQLRAMSDGSDIVYDGSQDVQFKIVDPDSCEKKTVALSRFPEIPEIPEQPCIPIAEGEPNYIPTGNQSKVVLDCDGCTWWYTCSNGWIKSCGGLPDLELLTPEDVDDICNNLRFMVHYQQGDCVNHRDMTLNQIAEWIQGCLCALIAVDEDTNAQYALDCIDGVIVKRPIPPICDQLNDITEETDPVDIGDVQLVYIDSNGDCYRGPGIGCCPAIALGATNAGGGVCVSFDAASLGPRGTLVYQARDNTFLVGSAIPGVLGGSGLLSINDTNPFPDSPAVAKIILKGGTNHRTLAPGNPNSVEDMIDIAYIYTLNQNPNADIPLYENAGLESSIVNVGKGNSSGQNSTDPSDFFARAGSSPLMVAYEDVPIGGSIQWYGQWWISIDLNDVAFGGLAPFFFHGNMFAAIEWHRA